VRRRDKTRVERVRRHESSGNVREHGRTRWVINEGEEGVFDAIVSFHLKSLTLSFSRFLIMLLTLQKRSVQLVPVVPLNLLPYQVNPLSSVKSFIPLNSTTLG